MASQWFLFINDETLGPFSSEEVKSLLSNGELTSSSLIWGPTLTDWRRVDSWVNDPQATANSTVENKAPPADVWHFVSLNKSHGPFDRAGLVAELRKVDSLDDILIWTKGMKEWAPLFEFHDLLSTLGANRRQFPRLEIQGKVIINTNSGTVVVPLLTLSESGCGVQLEKGIKTAEIVTLELHSPSLSKPVSVSGEVRYVSPRMTGLRFLNLDDSAREEIVSLIKQSQNRFVLKAS